MIKTAIKNWLGMKQKEITGNALIDYLTGNQDQLTLEEQLQTYDSNVWVNTCVSIRADVFADSVLYLEDQNGERIDKHPFLELINKPSPYMTRYDMMRYMSIHEDLTGNAYMLYDSAGKEFNKRKINRIQIMLPQDVTITTSPKTYIEKYTYRVNGVDHDFPPEQVTHFKDLSPIDMVYGTSPLKSLKYILKSDSFSNRWNYNFFKNGASIGTILEHENTLTDEVKRRLIAAFSANHKGAEKSHKTIILDGGLKVKEMEKKHRDMEFSEMQDKYRDKIIAAYRVPKILIAQYEGGSLAEAETAENVFAEFVIKPKLARFCQTLTLDLLPHFDNTGKLKVRYEDPVKANKEFEEKKLNDGINKWITINERRELEGLENVEGGDVIYQALNLVPLGTESIVEEEVVEEVVEEKPEETEEDKKKALIRKKIKNLSQEFKDTYAQKFILMHGKNEERFMSKLHGVFRDQQKDVLAKLEVHKTYKYTKSLADDVFNKKKWIKKFNEIFTPVLTSILVENADDASTLFGLGVTLTGSDLIVQQAVKKQVLKFAQEVNNTTKDHIRKELSEGLGSGEGIPDLSKRMKKIFKQAATYRTNAIARTETTKASNKGAIITYKESDVVDKKEWLATFDERTRTDHAVANGQVVGVDEEFLVGGERLEYPAAPTGSASNVINCRCTVLPVVE